MMKEKVFNEMLPFVAIASILLLLLPIKAVCQPKEYYEWLNLPLQTLYDKGKDFQTSEPDSAIICYTIIGNRYDKKLSLEEKRYCAKAYANKCYVYFFNYFDFSTAFENLIISQNIMDDIGEDIPEVYLCFGLVYSSFGNQSGDKRTTVTSFDYLRKAFYAAYKNNDGMIMNISFSNLISQSYENGTLDAIVKEWNIFRTFNNSSIKEYTDFNILLYKGLQFILKKNYSQAQECFDKQIVMLPQKSMFSRYLLGAWQYKSLAYSLAGDNESAISALKKAEMISLKFGEQDAKVEVYRTMAELYTKEGQKDNANHYQQEYLSIKDSLLNYQQVNTINEMKMLNDMKKVDYEMKSIKEKRRFYQNIAMFSSIILFIVVFFVYILFRKNRKLNRTNEMLYKKNKNLLDCESQYSMQRNEYEKKIELLQHKYEQIAGKTPTSVEQPSPSSDKYKNSVLSDDIKECLMDKVLKVMENDNEIYSTDFTIERLAVLVDSKYKYVSQIINERYNCNFNTFLNNFRIKEACKRIQDVANYGHLTIEAISVGVGFKSRSTFVLQFKRVTGLTPSEYHNIARKESKMLI